MFFAADVVIAAAAVVVAVVCVRVCVIERGKEREREIPFRSSV